MPTDIPKNWPTSMTSQQTDGTTHEDVCARVLFPNSLHPCSCERRISAPSQAGPRPYADVREYGDNWDIVPAYDGMKVVEMHCCGFTFDAAHTDEPMGGYTCPLCKPDGMVADEIEQLREQLENAYAEAQTETDRADIAADENVTLLEQVKELKWKLTCAEYSGDHNIADLHEWRKRAEMAGAALRELLACLDPTPREGRHDWLGHYDADECVFCDRGETGEHKANCPMKVADAALAQEGDK